MRKLTHDDLVKHAAKWLQIRHGVVITEMVGSVHEVPDAIGFTSNFTTLIECKVSHADFARDKKKHYRRYPPDGMGSYRYYLVPKGLLRPEEIPEGWGLIEIGVSDKRNTRMRIKATWYGEKNSKAETSLLVSALRRIGLGEIQGVSVKQYTYSTKNKATLGIQT